MSAVADTYTPRLKEQYENEIRPRLKEELGLDSIMQAPRIEKITLNMGVGEAKTESKLLDSAIEELTTIAGQRAQIRRARKSIAQFKLREGMAVGARVTLRGDADVRVSRPARLDRAAPDPRLPRSQPALARRPRQLLARHPRAAHLSRRSTTTTSSRSAGST